MQINDNSLPVELIVKIVSGEDSVGSGKWFGRNCV